MDTWQEVRADAAVNMVWICNSKVWGEKKNKAWGNRDIEGSKPNSLFFKLSSRNYQAYNVHLQSCFLFYYLKEIICLVINFLKHD